MQPAMTEEDNAALVRRPPSALEKAEPGAKRILSGMVADALALAQAKIQTQRLSALQPCTSTDLESWCRKGIRHYYGWGAPQDYAQAVHWFLKAAEQGHANAQCHLAFCYRRGKGVPQDYAQALQWYHKAEEQGNAEAQFQLGWCYVDGSGGPKNPVVACKWFRLASEQGHPVAKQQCADLSALMSPAELAESKRLHEEYWKRRQS